MQRAKANEKERLLAAEVEMMIPKEQESKEVWEREGRLGRCDWGKLEKKLANGII